MKWLVADIGGTNARFALWQREEQKRGQKGQPEGQLTGIRTLSVAHYTSFEDALEDYLQGIQPDAACFAVAGPVITGPIMDTDFTFTNSPWQISCPLIKARFGFKVLHLINDFTAQSWALAELDLSALMQIGGGMRNTEAPRVALGPGTGLGVGALIKAQGHWTPVSGEGGHMGFKPHDALDLELLKLYWQETPRISDEKMLAGFGLETLYRLICTIEGHKIKALSAKQIITQALEAKEPFALKVVDRHLYHLGALAGDLALLFSAYGGVYLSGGIASALAPRLKTGHLREGFENKDRLKAMIKDIPIYLVKDDKAALLGAVRALEAQL